MEKKRRYVKNTRCGICGGPANFSGTTQDGGVTFAVKGDGTFVCGHPSSSAYSEPLDPEVPPQSADESAEGEESKVPEPLKSEE